MRIFFKKNKVFTHRFTTKGFTLIELLVVIAIIGLLASVVFRATQQARSKGRDAGRIQAMLQIRNAIELFRTDKGYYPNGQVPVVVGDGGPESDVCSGNYQYNATNPDGSDMIPGLIPTYIKSFPKNPANPDDWCFVYWSNSGKDYVFDAYNYLENSLPANSPFWLGSPNSPDIYSDRNTALNSGAIW